MNKWDCNFLALANTVSMFSKDPSTKVGAVIVNDDNKIISTGYNGFPRGIKDDHRLDNRAQKYDLIVHAEANAIIHAKEPLDGCTIYTMPFQPCSRCAGLIIQAGIRRVVSVPHKEARWSENFRLAHDMLTEARIIVDF